MSGLISLLVYVLVIGLIVWLALWVISQLPLPAPFAQIARVIVVVVACLILIGLLWDVAGGGLSVPRLR